MNTGEIYMDVCTAFAQIPPGERRRPLALFRLFSSLDTGPLLVAVSAFFRVSQRLYPSHDWGNAIALVLYCGMAERPQKETVKLRDGQEVIIFDLLRSDSGPRTLNEYRDFVNAARDALLRGQSVAEAARTAWHGPLCGVTEELSTIEAAQGNVAKLADALRAEGYLTKFQKEEV